MGRRSINSHVEAHGRCGGGRFGARPSVASSHLLAALVRLTSKGSPLFIQKRAGVDGEPFAMFKFRTMVVDAERRLCEVVDVAALNGSDVQAA